MSYYIFIAKLTYFETFFKPKILKTKVLTWVAWPLGRPCVHGVICESFSKFFEGVRPEECDID